MSGLMQNVLQGALIALVYPPLLRWAFPPRPAMRRSASKRIVWSRLSAADRALIGGTP